MDSYDGLDLAERWTKLDMVADVSIVFMGHFRWSPLLQKSIKSTRRKEKVSVFTLQPSKDYKDREVILVSYESIHYSVEWQHIMETLVFTKDPHKWCKRSNGAPAPLPGQLQPSSSGKEKEPAWSKLYSGNGRLNRFVVLEEKGPARYYYPRSYRIGESLVLLMPFCRKVVWKTPLVHRMRKIIYQETTTHHTSF